MGMSLSTQTGLAGITAVLPGVLPVPWGWLVPSHHTLHPPPHFTGCRHALRPLHISLCPLEEPWMHIQFVSLHSCLQPKAEVPYSSV